MDTGVQLGRRFRALKLWMVLRYFGAEGIRARLEEHIRLARLFASWVDASPMFERRARAVQRRLLPLPSHRDDDDEAIDRFNASLMEAVNRSGEIFLSHTKLDGRFVIRLAVGNLRTTERHVQRAWDLLQEQAGRLGAGIIHPLVRWTPALGDKAPAFDPDRIGPSQAHQAVCREVARVSGSLQPSAVAVAASVACVRRAARAPAPRAADRASTQAGRPAGDCGRR